MRKYAVQVQYSSIQYGMTSLHFMVIFSRPPLLLRVSSNYHSSFNLKVPKREIFDRSDFPDFYTIKSPRVGDFVVKIQKILKNI